MPFDLVTKGGWATFCSPLCIRRLDASPSVSCTVTPAKGFFVQALSEKRKSTMAEERFLKALKRLVAEAVAEGLDAAELRRLFEETLTARRSA